MNLAEEWESIDVHNIFKAHDTLHKRPDTVDELSLEELEQMELLDKTGNKVPIYNVDGFRVMRQLGAIDPDECTLGVLVNLYT